MRAHALISLSLVTTVSCIEPDEPAVVSQAQESCVVIDDRSLIETDPAIVDDARFGLGKVLARIRATTPRGMGAQVVTLPSVRDMFRELYAAYGACGAGVDPQGYGLACRPAEAAIAELDPFTSDPEGLHFQPVAVVNRFDLAGAHASSCGESRIVYWKDRGPDAGKLGLIVELHTPPVIARGRRTCAPIVAFWASLSREDDPAVRAARLEAFYFEGLPGMAHAPVSARGAGWDGAGQLRANNFAQLAQWNLREAAWRKVCPPGGAPRCEARFVLVDTKGSPSQRLFAGTHPLAPAFADWFVDQAVARLARATDPTALAMGPPTRFDAYESVSQARAGDPTSVRYADHVSAALRARVTARLVGLGSALTTDDILARATATTCAGCHRISRGAALGGGLVFPSPLGFVHVGEGGALSPAMTEALLPRRRAALTQLACSAPIDADAAAPADTETILGEPMGLH